ncbi:MAG: chemotaxis protein CheA [Bacteroidales bacterium]|nr:chemotaxis protein CheA [Bacteroidales bacterium]
MDDFEKKFIEEANEFIENLEETLLSLEKDPINMDLINEVFRIMHSLKGTGAMFGFDAISDFTHHLENLYDKVREGEIQISKPILNVTLKSVDQLQMLLVKNPGNDVIKVSEEIIDEVNEIIENSDSLENITPEISIEKEKEKPLVIKKNQKIITTYFIHFKPHEKILKNGTNPLYLIDELNSMGTCKVFPRLENVPYIEDISLKNCYIYWDILLASDGKLNEIKDVFIFVEDDCDLEIVEIADVDLFRNMSFVEMIEQKDYYTNKIDIDDIKQFVNIIIQETDKKTPEDIPEVPLKEIIALNEKENKLEEKSSEKEEISIDNQPTVKSKNISTIRVNSEKIDQLMNIVSELITTQARLQLISDNIKNAQLVAVSETIQKMSRQLRDLAFDMSLIPVNYMFTRFRRLVRDLSSELNKEVEFVVEGGETELDKNIIEHLVDPIMHIIRNSIDHGIESKEQRKKLGKIEKGKICLKAYYSGVNVYINIDDDGSGINLEKIKSKAVKSGIIKQKAVLSEKDILDLVFIPGITASDKISNISGRGVGMDVVKRKIEEIRGEVEISSKDNEGTSITIKLPLTLSILDGMLVKVDKTFFVIPLLAIEKIYKVEKSIIDNSFNNIIVLDKKQIPFLNLRDEFKIDQNCPESIRVVIVNYENNTMGIIVDNVTGEYQAVIKPLGQALKNNDIFLGATILGDGTVALVMDTNKIINKFTNYK